MHVATRKLEMSPCLAFSGEELLILVYSSGSLYFRYLGSLTRSRIIGPNPRQARSEDGCELA